MTGLLARPAGAKALPAPLASRYSPSFMTSSQVAHHFLAARCYAMGRKIEQVAFLRRISR